MLATPGDLPVGPEWVYEVEWDGLRVLAEVVDGGLRLVTLEGQDVTPCFPELAGLTHLVPDVVLDGTVVLLTRGLPDADALAARLRGAPPGPHATLMLSDILRLYGVELHDRPQDERRATLERLDLGRVPGVVLSPVYTDGPALRAAAVARGLPGVLAKRRDAPYRAGPATAWVRVDGADPDGGGRATAGRAGFDHARCNGARGPPSRGGGRDGADHLAGGRRPRDRGHPPAAARRRVAGARAAWCARATGPPTRRSPPRTGSTRATAGGCAGSRSRARRPAGSGTSP